MTEENREKLPRTDSTQAMKSIFSAYGDDDEIAPVDKDESTLSPVVLDEASIDNISGSEDEGSSTRSHTPQVLPEKRIFEPYQTSPLAIETESKKPRLDRKAMRLVSYGPEEEDEDDEDEEEEEEETVSDEEEPGVEVNSPHEVMTTDPQSEMSEQDVQLPPEPLGKCSRSLQEKIARLYQKVSHEGQDLKLSIQQRKHFRNPSIYEKLIEFCAIDEKGTNYPPDLYNPMIWGPDSYYDELAKLQKIEMDKREKEKKERTKIDFVTGVKRTTSEGVEQKRKSKWDAQPNVKPPVMTTTTSNPPAVTVTTGQSGHKTTVISAVGTIKRPK